MCKILLCILAIFTPPLAVLLDRGCRKSFWINCLLTLFFFVPGVVHAFVVILSKNTYQYDSDHHHRHSSHHSHHSHCDEVVIESSGVQYVTPVVIEDHHHHHH